MPAAPYMNSLDNPNPPSPAQPGYYLNAHDSRPNSRGSHHRPASAHSSHSNSGNPVYRQSPAQQHQQYPPPAGGSGQWQIPQQQQQQETPYAPQQQYPQEYNQGVIPPAGMAPGPSGGVIPPAGMGMGQEGYNTPPPQQQAAPREEKEFVPKFVAQEGRTFTKILGTKGEKDKSEGFWGKIFG